MIEGRRKGQTREMSVGGVDKRLSRDKEETDMAHKKMAPVMTEVTDSGGHRIRTEERSLNKFWQIFNF